MRNEVIELYLDDIIPNRFQPREKFDQEALTELSTSIKEHGVIQPIIVRQIGDKYEIIAGERRYKASALAGLTKIPAIIRNLDDKEASKVALLENLQRKDLTAIEEARTYQKILELDSMTQEELGKTMGKSQAAIANKLRLLSLTDEVQEALLNDQISERHARSLLGITNGNDQIEMLNRVIRERMTVRELDSAIKNVYNKDSVLSQKEQKFMESTEPTVIEEKHEDVQQPIIIEEPQLTLFTPEELNNNTIETTSIELTPIKNELDMNKNVETPTIEEKKDDYNQVFEVKNPMNNNFIPNFDNIEENNNNQQVQEIKPTIESVSTSNVDNNFIENFKYQDAINLVKNVIPEINSKGVNANIQEFDLDNKYQIIINIDK